MDIIGRSFMLITSGSLRVNKFFLQIRGHHVAQLDPLGILQADLSETVPADLSLEYWGLGESLI